MLYVMCVCHERNGRQDGWMDGWMDGWIMATRTSELMHGQTGGGEILIWCE
jgi:hypothetical protein